MPRTPKTETPTGAEKPWNELSIEEQQAITQAHREKKTQVHAVQAEDRAEKELVSYKEHVSPARNLIWAQCPLPGFENFYVLYNIGIPVLKRSAQPILAAKKAGERASEFAKRFAEWQAEVADWMTLFVAEVDGWPFEDAPAPGGDNVEPLEWLWQNEQTLAGWMAYQGYDSALVASTKNS